MQLDDERFADIVALAIKTATAPLVARIHSLEQRAALVPRDGRDGIDGKDGAAGKDVDPSVVMELKAELSALRFDMNGLQTKSEDAPDLAVLVKDEVARAMALIPVPKDGQPGASIDPEDVDAMVAAHVTKALSDRTDPDPKAIADEVLADVRHSLSHAIAFEVQKAVDALPKPKDGVGLTGAFVDRDGHLIVTLSDGGTKDVGVVVGKDADMAALTKTIAEEVAKIPSGKDGRDGSLEQLKMAQVDDETVQFLRADGTPIDGGTVKLAGFFDKGVWKPDEVYRKGYAVTYAGSVFIAQRDTSSRPETDDSWRLAVKRGRDGRNGKDGSVAPKPPVKLNG